MHLDRWFRRSAAIAACVASLGATGCPVIFPEYGTHVSVAPKTESYDPPPPDDIHYIAFESAVIPPRTRDGREWGDVGGLPDPYLKLTVNGEELVRTNPESDTLTPKWADSPKGNFPIKSGDELRLEVWDARALVDHPIGVKTIHLGADFFGSPEQDIDFDGGLEVMFRVEPARPIWGAGFRYEIRTASVHITKVMEGSPAARANIKAGDELLKLGGKEASKMSADEVTGVLNTIPAAGLRVVLAHEDGSTLEATLKEGPIYGLFKDIGDPTKAP